MVRDFSSLWVLSQSVGTIGVTGPRAIADSPDKSKPAGQPEMKLPPGWTAADMKACVDAGTPGKMHEFLAKGVGMWQGKNTMSMARTRAHEDRVHLYLHRR